MKIMQESLKRYARFGLVGVTGICVDMLVLFILCDPKMLGLNLSFSKAVAAEIALLNNFFWNELWTFRDISAIQNSWRSRFFRLVKFNLICLAGIGISILLLNLQVRLISMNVYISNFIAVFIVSFWNFGMNVKFGWNKSNKSLGESELTLS